MNFDGRSVGRAFFVRGSSRADASSRSFSKRRALSDVDANNRPRRVTLRAEAAAISINILAAMVLKLGLADLGIRNRVGALELEVGVRRFLPQRTLVRAGHARGPPERVGPGADGRGAEEGRRARQVRGRPGRGAAAHLRQILDQACVDGRHRACVVRRRFSAGRVGCRVDGVLGPSTGGRRRLRRRFERVCLGWKVGCAPGRGRPRAQRAMRGLVPSERGLLDAAARRTSSPQRQRAAPKSACLLLLASVLRPLATSELRESPSTVQYNPGALPDPSQRRRS